MYISQQTPYGFMAKNCSKAKAPKKKASIDYNSRKRSRRARKQKRNPDGTFAKGYKSQMSSKSRLSNKTATTTKKTRNSHTPKMAAVTRVFEFRCSNTVQDKVISAVAENFTLEEIRMISHLGKPVVWSGSLPKDKKGAYGRVYDSNPGAVPEFRFMNESGEDTIVHEILHHLRTVDATRRGYSKTAYSVTKRGISRFEKLDNVMPKKDVSNAEESATVAEVEIRTKEPSENISGYWAVDKHTVNGKEIREKDRETLRRTKDGSVPDGTGIIGKDAIKMLNSNYPRTVIAFKTTKGTMVPAIDSFHKIFNLRKKGKW